MVCGDFQRRKCPSESSALNRASHIHGHIWCLPKLPTNCIRYKKDRHGCDCSWDGTSHSKASSEVSTVRIGGNPWSLDAAITPFP